ncbi:MAG: trypsin-like serine protease [Cyanobacteria bacterium CRU_2_1]|nr:trypsin-like serine protease [Cyanobacteria bacterium RU_5_0]NJR59293.1 trypsin-like serine protease [Cyanobacteria bacterium CRU_2_1]
MITRILAIVLGVVLAFSPFQVSPTWAEPIASPFHSSTLVSEISLDSIPDAPIPIAQAPLPQQEGSFVAAAVEKVGRAVVRIDTERTITRGPDPFYDDPFFRRFFGNGLPTQPYEERLQGQGSGFIVDGNGTILTNAHVVEDADQVTVILKDGRRFNGEVLGVDEVTDLAVVKINTQGESLPTASLGDSDHIKVGDWAIAVGNPLGLDNTVTLGIVSTLNRSSALVGIPDKRLDFIQTDAAINPGNSGGPLLNERGEVIGINTAIRANAMGIGFAIPINKAKEIAPVLASGGQVSHPYLGVQIATLTPDLAKQNNADPNTTVLLPEVNGVLVVGVVPDSPAASAGIRRGDVIVQVEGQPVASSEQLQSLIDRTTIGQSLQVMLKRGDRTQQLSVRTAELRSST